MILTFGGGSRKTEISPPPLEKTENFENFENLSTVNWRVRMAARGMGPPGNRGMRVLQLCGCTCAADVLRSAVCQCDGSSRVRAGWSGTEALLHKRGECLLGLGTLLTPALRCLGSLSCRLIWTCHLLVVHQQPGLRLARLLPQTLPQLGVHTALCGDGGAVKPAGACVCCTCAEKLRSTEASVTAACAKAVANWPNFEPAANLRDQNLRNASLCGCVTPKEENGMYVLSQPDQSTPARAMKSPISFRTRTSTAGSWRR